MRVGDYGNVIRVTIKEDGAIKDISSATTKQYRLIRPDGEEFVVTAAFLTDGTDGKLAYTITSGLLTKPGAWQIQALLTYSAAYLQSSIGRFSVEKN